MSATSEATEASMKAAEERYLLDLKRAEANEALKSDAAEVARKASLADMIRQIK